MLSEGNRQKGKPLSITRAVLPPFPLFAIVFLPSSLRDTLRDMAITIDLHTVLLLERDKFPSCPQNGASFLACLFDKGKNVVK
jgi:hypothetical protein